MATHKFKKDEIAEFKAAFDEWDTQGSDSVLDGEEMKSVIKKMGLDVKLLAPMMKEIDVDGDGNINFQEFLGALWKLKQNDSGSTGKAFGQMVERQVDLMQIKTKSGGMKSYSPEEISAFANHLNYCLGDDKHLKYLMPIDPSSMDLCKKVKDGVLLAKFINMIEPDTIDWRAVNYKKSGKLNQYHIIENQNLVLSAAKSIGLRVYNISAEDLRDADKNPILVLGFMWQAVKMQLLGSINLKACPELIRLLQDGEDMETLMALPPEEILKRWVNYHLDKQGYNRKLKNFGKDVKDGNIYTVLLHSIGPKKNSKDPLKWDENKRRREVINAAQRLGCKPFITDKDIAAGNEKLNMAFVAQLFNTAPGLEELNEEEEKQLAGIIDDDVGDTREERAFRMWMNSLGLKKTYINNLFEDCRSGLALLKVIDKIEPGTVKWSKVERRPKNKFKKVSNNNYAIVLGKQLKLTLVNMGGSDIVDRNKKLLLGFTWQLMRYHMLKFLSTLAVKGKKVDDKDILNWANSEVKKSGKNKQLRKWGDVDNLQDGLFFIYLVATLNPDIVDWELVTQGQNDEDALLNARYAISIARKLGAVVFLLPEDIIEGRSKMCLTFGAAMMALKLQAGSGKVTTKNIRTSKKIKKPSEQKTAD